MFDLSSRLTTFEAATSATEKRWAVTMARRLLPRLLAGLLAVPVSAAPAAFSLSAPPAPPTVLSAGAVFVLPLARPAALFTEMPPTLLHVPLPLPGGGGCPRVAAAPALAAYLSTGYVGLCVANASALPVAAGAGALGFDADSCSEPFSGESWRSWPPDDVPPRTEWKRNYDGVMAALPLGGAQQEPASLLLVRHGEHKNELCWANDLLYQGLINADVLARDCYSGFVNGTGPYEDCQRAYNAFVSGALLQPFSEATCFGLGALGNASTADLGPIAWPVDGYLNASGGKSSYGVRQPGAVVAWDGAAYLFWIDNGFASADIWIARSAPGTDQGTPASFRAYDHAAGTWSLPVLPAGFDSRNVSASLHAGSPAGAASGGSGAPAFPLAPDAGSVHFAAARLTAGGAPTGLHLVVYDIVNYTECYEGRGEDKAEAELKVGQRVMRDLLFARQRLRARQEGASGAAGPAAGRGGGPADEPAACVPPWRLFLRLTADFVTFSQPVELERYASPGWAAAPLAYSTLLSLDGTRQDEVDADGFFVLGTCAQPDAPCGSSYGPQVTAALVSVALSAASFSAAAVPSAASTPSAAAASSAACAPYGAWPDVNFEGVDLPGQPASSTLSTADECAALCCDAAAAGCAAFTLNAGAPGTRMCFLKAGVAPVPYPGGESGLMNGTGPTPPPLPPSCALMNGTPCDPAPWAPAWALNESTTCYANHVAGYLSPPQTRAGASCPFPGPTPRTCGASRTPSRARARQPCSRAAASSRPRARGRAASATTTWSSPFPFSRATAPSWTRRTRRGSCSTLTRSRASGTEPSMASPL